MKKLFTEKKFNKKGIMEFLDRKGFYIVLILCIAIVGGTAVYVTTKGIAPDDKSKISQVIPDENEGNALADVGGDASKQAAAKGTSKVGVVKDTEKTKVKPTTVPKKTTTSVKKASNSKTSSSKTTSSKAVTTVPNITMAKPVFGSITYGYAMDKLVYSKTLDDWRTHSGVDIAADRGTTVHAVAEGFVSDIKNDPRIGITIVIDHKNGLKTYYSNLASDEMVTPNQVVKKGDVIGCVGNTAAFESAEQSHLHFEVWKSGKAVNPAQYLPKK